MKYLCLIYDDEQLWARMPAAERDAVMDEYRAFSGEIHASGHFVGGAQLQPSATATIVRVRDGRLAVTDGPFAETKEQLGGYFLIEARDLNEALQVAQRIPSARLGTVEVRPLVPLPPDMPLSASSASAAALAASGR